MQTPSPSETVPRLLMRHITKTFPGVVANDAVTLAVQAGEVHALLGENGAGKTTLMHILYGLCQPDTGEILVRGQPVRLRSPRHAIALGTGLVAQHFLLVRRHTVAENVALGLPGTRFFWPAQRLEQRLHHLGERYGLAVEPRARIWQLSAGEQQAEQSALARLVVGREITMGGPQRQHTPGTPVLTVAQLSATNNRGGQPCVMCP